MIRRESIPGAGELVRIDRQPGGIATAEVCVLDDIGRAPGEALNVLLRVLNERKIGVDSIPLACAIATGNPYTDHGFVEELDPAQLDRFTIQVEVASLLTRRDWTLAFEVLDMADPPPSTAVAVAVAAAAAAAPTSAFGAAAAAVTTAAAASARCRRADWRGVLKTAQRGVPLVSVPADVRERLIGWLKALRGVQAEYDAMSSTEFRRGMCHPGDAHAFAFSDRTFLVKSVRLIQASAVIAGRTEATRADLAVLGFLVTFRLPQEVRADVAELLGSAMRDNVDEPPPRFGDAPLRRKNLPRRKPKTQLQGFHPMMF